MDHKAYWRAAAAGVPLLAFLYWRSRAKTHPPFPPGPPRDPIIGSLRNFPKARWPEAFSKLQKVYGDLIYFNVLGQPLLVVNSLEDAQELMEKRGNIHSGRPEDVMNYTV
jgi:Cytochrome P450